MKKNILIKLTIATYIVFIPTTTIVAQNVGINTSTPTATLEIQSEGNSSATKSILISNAGNVNLHTVLNNGYIGLGTVTPATRIDLRGTNGGNNIIGIGNTTLTASQAKGGAVKYASDTKELQYSDGDQWLILESSAVRDCVIASNDYNMMVCPNNTTTRLGNWTSKYDPTNTFDPILGIFTAPKTGLYTATFSIHMVIDKVAAGSYLEGQWIASNGETIKCINAFPIAGSYMASIICSGTIKLNKGDTLYPQVFHNTGTDKHLRVYGDTPSNPVSDLNFNNISIVIQ